MAALQNPGYPPSKQSGETDASFDSRMQAYIAQLTEYNLQEMQAGRITADAAKAALDRANQIAIVTAGKGMTPADLAQAKYAVDQETLRSKYAEDAATGRTSATNWWEMERLKAQIAGQQGIATADQAAEMARLQAQIAGTSALTTQQSTLQNQTEQQRYLRALEQTGAANTRMDEVMARFGLGGTPTGGGAAPTYDSGATDAQERSAEDAAFARAKDKIGLATRAGAQSLSEEMAMRGITGSGVEAQRVGSLIETGVGEQGQAIRDQALETLKRRYQVNDRNAALGSTKRAQDIGLVQSLASLARPTGGGIY